MSIDNKVLNRIIGIGPIIVDKGTGSLYLTGSGDSCNLPEDFMKYNRGEESIIDWERRKTHICK